MIVYLTDCSLHGKNGLVCRRPQVNVSIVEPSVLTHGRESSLHSASYVIWNFGQQIISGLCENQASLIPVSLV